MRNVIFIGILLIFCTSVTSATYNVSTPAELLAALDDVIPGDEILLHDGTYNLPLNQFAFAVYTNNVIIRSQSGSRDAVIINGWGMYANGHHGFYVGANDVTIRDLTIQNVRYHCIQTDLEVDGLTVINCVLRDAGEQMLKVPGDGATNFSEDGYVEGCLFYYTAGIGPRDYIGGIDCHNSRNWIVKNNIFKYIISPGGGVAEHAIHFWRESEGTMSDGNLIIDCDRGIGYGLGTSSHVGGVIRNNIIYHRGTNPGAFADVGIGLETAPDVRVYNNTIYFENTYPNAIEYRFSATSNVYIGNNLTNKDIRLRDGASGTLSNNIENTIISAWFASTDPADPVDEFLHIKDETITQVIDQGTAAIPGIPSPFYDFDGDTRPQGGGIDIGADEYAVAGMVNVNYDFPAEGWYMVSLPGTAADMNVSGLFPGACQNEAYLYVNDAYQTVTAMETGHGYWLYFEDPSTASFDVVPIQQYSLALAQRGWHMIGGVISDVDASSITSVPADGFYQPVFIYENGGYVATETVESQGACWLAAAGPCTITVTSDALLKSAAGAVGAAPDTFWGGPPPPPEITDISNSPVSLPAKFELEQNFPNPFNPHTTIRYSLAQAGRITLEIVNLQGERVIFLVNGEQNAGDHVVFWDGSFAPSGIYLCRMVSGEQSRVIKMVLVK
ncbi:T9SS type A sorting domain-containing protein [candidate division KSB1 bacterium]|nr:T9SS type A sorting domain-containing protein [candidate division KSB1 bacterium]